MDPLNTFYNHLNENKDNDKQLLLKIDIEGAEWDILDNLNEILLTNVAVLIVEFHGFEKINDILIFKRVLKKINNIFSVFHVHGNNCSNLLSVNSKLFPNVIEVTYINNNYINSKQQLNVPLNDTDNMINCFPWQGYNLNYWLSE
ncbi:FkbM family methyltransferase [Candidatus Babela massiliensis]|uniref:Methyltransferase FkbM domain n=1 Tax=Candidatus Babela massiliensis TaxID=673862 RepID=V6DIQ3_9BACT|nr:FkbM family methyltransferase [Candidatus Babela massiliensis]CDK30808.1 Methyltransferase FkbM domain [Candidatus Babela massiliensis]